jgi:acyl-CoA reductase-like NAD-dependent aldehyde dehydrogenase
VELANHSRYGLGAGIWTQNLSRAHRVAAQLDSGLVWVNTHHRNDPSSPWGGMKESGIGRENGIEAFEACKSCAELVRCWVDFFYALASYHADSQSKSTIVNIAPTLETREYDDWFGDEVENKRYG